MADFEKIDNILGKLYYDPKTGYGGIQALSRQAKAKGHKIPLAEIKRWLKEQDTFINPFIVNFKGKNTESPILMNRSLS